MLPRKTITQSLLKSADKKSNNLSTYEKKLEKKNLICADYKGKN